MSPISALRAVRKSAHGGALPALTAACSSRVKVKNALTVESINHLFVFHLVDHLCISMVGVFLAPGEEDSNF